LDRSVHSDVSIFSPALHTVRLPAKKVATVPVHVQEAFSTWMNTQNIKFRTPAEQNYRMRVFAKTYAKIAQENESQKSYTMALNKFSAMTEEEFVAKFTGLRLPKKLVRNVEKKTTVTARPDSIDWTTKGAVGAIKDQGQCGSCWAFSATASVEGAWQILNGGTVPNLSEQQMVDCSSAQGNEGCNGGWMDQAFQYLVKAGGQDTTHDYPYTAKDGKCKASTLKPAAKISGFKDVPKNNCNTLLDFAAAGPTSVAIAANAIMNYNKGVFSNTSCGTGLNHGVTLVGYGRDTTVNKDFYLVRNSWGKGWGENGYIRMDRSIQASTGICGICMAASSAVATKA